MFARQPASGIRLDFAQEEPDGPHAQGERHRFHRRSHPRIKDLLVLLKENCFFLREETFPPPDSFFFQCEIQLLGFLKSGMVTKKVAIPSLILP